MNLLLSFIAAVTASINSIGIRLFEEKVQKNRRDLQAYQAMYIFLSGVVFLLLSGLRFPVTTAGWLLTVAFGLCLAVSSIGTAESYLCGPMSLSGVIISCNVVMPVVFGCLVYREILGVTHLIGIGFLLLTFVLTGLGSGEGKKGIFLKWILMVLLGFLGNGFGAIVLAIYARLPEPANDNGFMAVGFFLGAVMLLSYTMFTGRGGVRFREPVHVTKPFMLLAVWAAIGCFLTNLLIIYLSGVMPASLLHPIYNGTSGVMITLVSCLCFRERMDRRKALILTLGICAVVFLNL